MRGQDSIDQFGVGKMRGQGASITLNLIRGRSSGRSLGRNDGKDDDSLSIPGKGSISHSAKTETS